MLAGNGKHALFFLKGGTAAVTAHQVGVAAIGAIEQGTGGTSYPLGGINLHMERSSGSVFLNMGQGKDTYKYISEYFWIIRFFKLHSDYFSKQVTRIKYS